MTNTNICSTIEYRGIHLPPALPELFYRRRDLDAAFAPALPQLPGSAPPRLRDAAGLCPHKRLVPRPPGRSAGALSGFFSNTMTHNEYEGAFMK